MPTRRLLYLSAHQMCAFRWQAGVVVEEGRFATTEAGRQQFAGHLARHPEGIYSLLANVAEESFQIDAIPYLRGADRKAIISRRLGQLFFNSPLTACLSLGHQKTRRKNERIMLAALTNNAFFEPWLKALADGRIALSGLYSLPFLGAALRRKLKLAEERCLLLTVQDQSIRQSYFEGGELHFSRLTPLHDSSLFGIAQAFASEALRTQQYLASQRLIGEDRSITAHLLAHRHARQAIDACCIDSGTIRFNILDSEDCARQIGLQTPQGDSRCEPLFLHLLATATPRTQYADDALRHEYHLRQLRSALHGAGAIALLGGLLFAGTQLLGNYAIDRESDVLKAEATLARQRYRAIAETFPAMPADHETLRRVINRYADLERKNASPTGLYREISRALDAAAPVEIDAIEWRAGDSTTSGSPVTGGAALADGNEAAIVRGTLRRIADATPRQALAVFKQLLDTLQANPRLQINVVQQPFDVESGKSLKGGNAATEDNNSRAFSIQISRQSGP